jgi:hypothetical protein
MKETAEKDKNIKIHRNEGPKRLGHTILYVYPDELSSIGFDTTSGDSNGNNSLRIEAGKMQKFYIPNGATHVHIEGQGASGDKFCYVVTG